VSVSACFLTLACLSTGYAAVRPSFWLSRCAWEATDVVELAIAPGDSRFRVVASIKGTTRIGATKVLPELAPPPHDRSLLKDLTTISSDKGAYQIAPPIRETDRLIVFLRAGNKPANSTLLTSTIWLQDGVGYTFRQTMNPGPTHLVPYFVEDLQVVNGKPIWKPQHAAVARRGSKALPFAF